MDRRVLFVAYDFPPRRSSAVYRFAGMMKYMHRFGWDEVIERHMELYRLASERCGRPASREEARSIPAS